MRHLRLSVSLLTAAALAGCTGTTKSSPASNPTPPPSGSSVTVTVSPASANVRAGATKSFGATVAGSSNTAVTWQVNGVAGGGAATGTISASGMYTAPATLPSSNTVTVRAVSSADATATGSSAVTLQNPVPVLTGIAPTSVPAGAFAITVNGSGYASGAQVLLAGAPLATTFVSSTQLTATGSEASAGNFSIAVMNPNPGSATSASQNLQVTSTSGGNPPPSCSGMSLGQSASLNGFVPFPADNLWNQDISSAALDPNSSAIINFIGSGIGLHPDFGSGLYNGQSMGIPYLVVGSQQGPVPIVFTAYGDESDPGPMPIPVSALIEGYPAPGSGDRHVLVLDNNDCWLYELYSSSPNAASWNAGSAAVWDLTADEQRPYTWTSADAAGLPIFPGLARYDEVASGHINHALRFTLQSSRAAFVPPASHWAANSSNALAAPMGMRLRLKASFDISTFSAANQVILTALKKYGMIMADNGSSMYISGAPDDNWDNSDLHNLGSVTAADFEVVKMNPIYTAANVPAGASPAITSFTASSQVISAGTPVTLSWNVSGASYLIVSPDIGAVRGTSTVVSPTQSTTYTLYATNAFGRTTATVNITVH
ncbi:MAG TPA: IPT/TIG domain-containing protein [Verrucomicrobiae bacterium]|nr:IPT/TIG domain-containing protein [Verrucomicrobiae bacterium]